LRYGGERLADLTEAQPVWIVEGEKKSMRCKHAARSLFQATPERNRSGSQSLPDCDGKEKDGCCGRGCR
jgi:hypothetical protein